jgi:polyhydroxyalkanoate synthesis regulator phasin
MNEERKKILDMLAEGKITADEADRLLSAISKNTQSGNENSEKSGAPKYIRVLVEPGSDSDKSDRVNIRVPIKLIRAGLKFTSLIPKNAQDKVNQALNEKGIDLDLGKIRQEDLEELIQQLDDLTVNIEGKETVKIFCE